MTDVVCQKAIRIAFVFIVFLFCGAAALPAQDQPTYAITHYDLRIEPDFAAKTLREFASVEIANPKLADSFSFLLSDNYKILSLKASGSETSVRHENGVVDIELRRPQKKAVLSFDIESSPGKSRDEQRAVVEDQSLFLLWSDCWYPADFDQWATVRTTVVLPPTFQAIAPGRLISGKRRRDRIEYTFQTSHPAVSFSIFADSRWIRTERQVKGRRLITLLHPESQKYASQILSTSADVLEFFAGLHGCYPFDQFAFITITGIYARRAFTGWIGYSPEYLEKEMARTGYDAHETSLLWWGLTSHGRGPGSWQWTEGLGDYVEVMYGESRNKPLPQNFVRFRSDFLATPPEEDVPYDKLRGDTAQKIIHGKFPWTMQVMRECIGDGSFRLGVRLLFEKYRFRTFSIEEFVSVFEKASSQSLSWWRKQWLERRGVPVISFDSSIASSGNGYRITCRLTQNSNIYDLPLEIGIRTANNIRIEKIFLHDRTAEFAFDSAERPLRIVLDPNDRILMKK